MPQSTSATDHEHDRRPGPEEGRDASASTATGTVSVIIPTYNRSHCLVRAVDSCLRQTHPDVEVIIIDDGSTDDTPAVVAALLEQHGPERIRYTRQENAGACVARNRGLDEASGTYIQFLDSDDYLDAAKFTRQIEALDASGLPVAVCDYQNVFEDDNGTVTPGDVVRNDGNLHARIAGGHCPQTCAPLMRADSIPPVVRFQQGLPRKQDMDFFFRYFLTVRAYDYTPGAHCFWVHHESDRITDPNEKTPVYEMFTAAHRMWQEHRTLISRLNWWMLRRNGLRCARRAWGRGHKRQARELALKALSVPCGLRHACGLWRVILLSFIPDFALNVARCALRRPGKSDGQTISTS